MEALDGDAGDGMELEEHAPIQSASEKALLAQGDGLGDTYALGIPSAKASPADLSWVVRDQNRLTRLDKLRVLFNNPRYSDVTLRPTQFSAQDGEPPRFYGCKNILAVWSPTFESLFYTNDQVGFFDGAELDVEASPETVEMFLRFIHEGEVVVKLDGLWPLYCFLNTYQVVDLVDRVEDIMDKAVSVDTCCHLLASAQQLGSYDHYALRKCLNMLLMDFTEVGSTAGFTLLDFDILAAVISSDELNAAEEFVFEACMEWLQADEARVELYLDGLLQHIRFPLCDSKFVASLDAHPIAARSPKLQDMMLSALKFAVNPRMKVSANPQFRQRKGGLYWKVTKNNMCMDLSGDGFRTYLLNTSCDLIAKWKLKVELYQEGSVVVGIAEEGADVSQYVGRYSNGWGLGDNGHWYNGGCKCPPSVRHLCTPLCQGHIRISSGQVLFFSVNCETGDFTVTSGTKSFTQRIQNLPKDTRVFPAVSVRSAKVRIFAADADTMD